jgi:hypothetical protein
MAKFQKLKQVKNKMDKIFYGAGGKPENMKEAILKGKGNQNHEVPLSGFESGYDVAVTGMDERTPMTKLLGQEMYYSEFMNGTEEIEGLGSLGEPVTATAIASASGVMAAIAALLKNIGNLFPKKNKEAADFDNTADADKEAANVNQTQSTDLDQVSNELDQQANNVKTMTTDPGTSDNTTTDNSTTDNSTTDNGTPKDQTFWEKNRKWLKPTLWGTGILSAIGLGYLAFKPKKPKTKKEKALEGLKHAAKKRKSKKHKVKTIQLK